MKKILIIAFLFLGCSALNAADYKTLENYDKANQAYNDANYSEAIKLYQNALKSGFEPAYLYYNMGNAYFRDNQLGNAIAAYRTASRIKPRDVDIKKNLQVAREQTMDGISAHEIPAAVKTFLFVFYYIGIDELVAAGAILLALVSLIGIVRLYLKWHFLKTLFRISSLLLFITLITIGAHWYFDVIKRSAVVNCASANVRSGPNKTYPEMFILHDGAEVKIVEKDNQWCKIQIKINAENQRGWIEAKNIIKI